MGLCLSWVPHMLSIGTHSVVIFKHLTPVSILKSQLVPLPHMWLQKERPLNLTALTSLDFQINWWYIYPSSTLTNKLKSLLLSSTNRKVSLPVCSHILQNLAPPTSSNVSNLLFPSPSFLWSTVMPIWSCPPEGSHSVIFLPFTSGLLQWKMTLLVSTCASSQSSSHSHLAYFPFNSAICHSTENVLISYLLTDKWNGVFSVFSLLNLSATFT